MPVTKAETISVADSGDIVAVRQAVRRQAISINLSLVDQTKIVTAASELARNMLLYGRGGEVSQTFSGFPPDGRAASNRGNIGSRVVGAL